MTHRTCDDPLTGVRDARLITPRPRRVAAVVRVVHNFRSSPDWLVPPTDRSECELLACSQPTVLACPAILPCGAFESVSRGGHAIGSIHRGPKVWRVLSKGVIWVATVCAWGSAAAPVCAAASQQAPPETTLKSAAVTAITTEITIDGALDETAWRAAPKIGDLTQRQPEPGQPPTERTEVALLHDGNYLYIGITCYDSEPQKIIGTQMARDANLNSDDRLEIVLDTFRDQRNAFFFSTNPAGALVDALAFANGQSNNEWDAIWDVRTRRTADGWVAEFAIPFKSLGFPSDRTVWGFNVGRFIQRKLEDDRWSGARLDLQFLQVSEAGEITNLAGLTQGVGLDVRPFVGGSWLRLGALDRRTVKGKPGLDMFYNFTPSLKLTATVNTDFGETEVDARQINLSRFSLLFPEKRSFFLEDAGVFSFASAGPNPPGGVPQTGAEIYPFFSRQVGLLAGQEVPLDVGVKLTGKVGQTDLGVLDVRTRDVPAVSDKNFFVGRVRRNLLQQSYIGAIFTDGHPALPLSSRTFGADVRLATSRFLGGRRNLVVNAYGLRSVNERRSGRDWSRGFSIQYPNDKFNSQFILRDIQDNFRPALGFVQRSNVRLLRAGGSYNPRPRSLLGIQQLNHDLYYTRFTRLDTGELESSEWHLTWLDWHFKSGDSLHSLLDVNVFYERLFAPFVISPGVVLPVGEYRFTRWRHQAATAAKRRLQASANWSLGRYWSGTAETLQTTINYKIPPRFNISVTTNQTFAHLPQGNFTARILSTQVNYAASPLLTLSNLIQYDNRSRNLGWQSRARWTLRPGNDLFLVFGQGWIREATTDGGRFRVQDTKVSTKLQFTARF